MAVDVIAYTRSKLNLLPESLRRRVRFYAPLYYDTDYKGIEPITFTRTLSRNAIWRDGAQHSVSTDLPRFMWNGETPLGMFFNSITPTSEVFGFAANNRLHDGGHLFWVQDLVIKRAPSDTNPFNSSGVWTGLDKVHIRDIMKFNLLVLTTSEITIVNSVLNSSPYAVPSVPSGTASGAWVRRRLSGEQDDTNKTYNIFGTPVANSLLVFHNLLQLALASPATVSGEYSVSAQEVTLFQAPILADYMWVQYVETSAGSFTWVQESLSGTMDDSNKDFSTSQVPITESLIVVHRRAFLTPVNWEPSTGEYYQYPSSAWVRLGIAPTSGDDLWAIYCVAGTLSSGMVYETPAGALPGTSFTLSATPKANSTLGMHQGLPLQKIGAGPVDGQYTQSGTAIVTGATIQSGDYFKFRYDT